jgi:hypothetical protein
LDVLDGVPSGDPAFGQEAFRDPDAGRVVGHDGAGRRSRHF